MLTICAFSLLIIWAIDSLYKSGLKKDYNKGKQRTSISCKSEKRNIKRNSVYDWNNENAHSSDEYQEFSIFDPLAIYELEITPEGQKGTKIPLYSEFYCKDACVPSGKKIAKYKGEIIQFSDIKRLTY